MKIPKYRAFILVAFIGATLFFVFQMGFLGGKAPRQATPRGFELLDTLIQLIRNDYLEEKDPVHTTDGALRGLVNSLDSVSAYLDGNLAGKYDSMKDLTFQTGLVLYKRYGSFPLVVGTIENSPAVSSKVQPGDVISAIDGRNALVMSLTEAELLLGSTNDSPVLIKVLRGNETLEINVPRARVSGQAYELRNEPGKPACLRIRRFVPGLAAAIEKEAGPILLKGKKNLVIDLRNTVGFEYEPAREFLNLFIKNGSIGVFRKKNGDKVDLACGKPAPFASVKTIAWVNTGTMGAAEVAAGVLRELRGIKLVGYETPGLAAERTIYRLDNEAAIILAVSAFSLPSGKSLWGEGLKPDLAMKPEENNDGAFLEKSTALFSKSR